MKLLRFSSILFVSLLALASPALAQSPEETVREILDKLQTSLDTSVIVDYVDWDRVYFSTPAKKLQEMGITSAEQMKERYRAQMKNPFPAALEEESDEDEEEEEENLGELLSPLKRIEKQAKGQADVRRKRLKNAQFEVGTAQITSDRAVVPVSVKLHGETRKDAVTLVRTTEGWLLPSPKFGRAGRLIGGQQ